MPVVVRCLDTRAKGVLRWSREVKVAICGFDLCDEGGVADGVRSHLQSCENLAADIIGMNDDIEKLSKRAFADQEIIVP